METSFTGLSVLVTGATGFIGSHLTRALVSSGAQVHVLVRPESAMWRLEDVSGDIVTHEADIRDCEAVREAVQQARPVKLFHLASAVNAERDAGLTDVMIEVNLRGTINLMQALDGMDVDCVVNTGTCEEYGLNTAPFVESQREMPISPYSVSKVAATHWCQMMYRTTGLPVVTVRPFLTYGPMQTGRLLIPALIRAGLLGQPFDMTLGEQTREFNYVDDIVDGYLRTAVCPAAIGQIINIGNGKERRIVDVARLVIELLNRPMELRIGALPYRAGEQMRFYCCNEKARTLLGWFPKTSLEEGLRRTVTWYREYLGQPK